MPSKPSNLAEFASGSAPIVEPTLLQKQNGWTSAFKPPAQWFNWWMNLVYQWIVWLDAYESTAHTWSADQTINARVTVAPTVANPYALKSTALGTGIGLWGVGGPNAMGAPGTSSGVYGLASGANASGVYGLSAAGPGVYGESTTWGGYFRGDASTIGAGGVIGIAGGGSSGTNYGVAGQGAGGGVFGQGVNTGNGVVGIGGATDGAGVSGTGNGNGAGGLFFGSGTGPSVLMSHLTGLVAWMKILGAQPASSDPFTNALTKLNVIKAWGLVMTGASPSILAGFNITSVALQGAAPKYLRVTMATAMASTNYIVIVVPINPGVIQASAFSASACNFGSNTFDFSAVSMNTVAQVDFGTSASPFAFVVLGAQ